jgi:predicted DNA-binding transcriptional regulator YafY
MPKNAGGSADLERLYWFDAEIRSGRFPSAARLAERFEISPKAAQASLERMRDVLRMPLEYVPERHGYRYWQEAFQLPPIWLQGPRATSLIAAYDLMSHMVAEASDPADREALQRLLNLAGISPSLRDRLTFETVEHHPPSSETLVAILSALSSERVLAIAYAGKEREGIEERLIEPRVLHNFAGNWYLFAFCRLRQDLRMFSLDRMRAVQVLDERFDYPADFDPQAFVQRAFGVFKTGPVREARLQFSPFISTWVVDQVWHRDQVVVRTEVGGLEMRLPYAGDGVDLVREVMKFGPEVVVVEPVELREAIVRRLARTMTRYDNRGLPPETGEVLN